MFPDLAILEKPFLNMSRGKVRNSEMKQLDDSNQNSDKNANLNNANYAKDDSAVDFNCNSSGKSEGKFTSSDGSSESDYIVVMYRLLLLLFKQIPNLLSLYENSIFNSWRVMSNSYCI